MNCYICSNYYWITFICKSITSCLISFFEYALILIWTKYIINLFRTISFKFNWINDSSLNDISDENISLIAFVIMSNRKNDTVSPVLWRYNSITSLIFQKNVLEANVIRWLVLTLLMCILCSVCFSTELLIEQCIYVDSWKIWTGSISIYTTHFIPKELISLILKSYNWIVKIQNVSGIWNPSLHFLLMKTLKFSCGNHILIIRFKKPDDKVFWINFGNFFWVGTITLYLVWICKDLDSTCLAK